MPTGTHPPLLPGVLQLAQHYECGPCQATNVFHFLCHETGGLGTSDVSTMVSDLAGFWINDFWKHYAAGNAQSTTVDATYALIEGQPNVKKVHIADAVSGINETETAQAQVCLLVNWDNGDARRGGKPRTYSPFPPENDFADTANVDGSVLTAAAASLVTFHGHVEGHTVGALVCDHLVDYSEVNHGAWRVSGVTFPISGGTLSPYAATQRRRVDRLRS